MRSKVVSVQGHHWAGDMRESVLLHSPNHLNCGCGGEYKHPTHTTFTYCILGTISVRTSDKLELFLVLFMKYMTTDHYALMCDNGLLSTEHFISHNSLSSRASVDGLVCKRG